MADDDVRFEDVERWEKPTLIISLFSTKPIDMKKIGRLLIDLQSDYRRSGHSLVLANVQTGSLYLFLMDALTWAASTSENAAKVVDGGIRLVNFAKGLTKGIQKADAPILPDQREPDDMKSVVRMVEIAADAGAGLQVALDKDATGANRITMVTLTPAEAKWTNTQLKKRKAQRRAAQPALPSIADAPKFLTSTSWAPKPIAPEQFPDEALFGTLNKRLGELSDSAPSDDVRALVAAIADILKSIGNMRYLEVLARSMEEKGKKEIARIIREHIPPEEKTLLLPGR